MEKCRSGQLNLPKNLKGNTRDLVKLLLIDDPNQRLDISQLKDHSFFRGLDWQKLQKRHIEPPFRPELYRGFEHIFEEEKIERPASIQASNVNFDKVADSPGLPLECPSPLLNNSKLEDILEIESQRNPIQLTKNKIKELDDGFSSKNYSATGGTGEEITFLKTRKQGSSSKLLGGIQMSVINKAFIEF